MRLPELGIYLLPGHSDRPADLLDEVRAAGVTRGRYEPLRARSSIRIS